VLFFYPIKVRVVNSTKYIRAFWFYILIHAVFAFVTNSFFTGIATFIARFMVSFIVISTIKDKRTFYKIIDMLILSSFILGILGIYEALSKTYIFQGNLLNASNAIRYGVLRCAVTFGHPINFGLYQAIMAILIFYRMNTQYNPQNKKRYITAYIISVVSMFMSVSRLAICLYLAVQILLLLQMGLKKFVKIICYAVFAIVMAVVLDLLGLGIVDLFSEMLEMIIVQILGLQSSAKLPMIGMGNRFDLYEWVIDAVGENFIFGMGVGALFEYKMNDWFTKTSIEVHYLYIFYQCGLVGLISLIACYINSLFFFNENKKTKLKEEKLVGFSKLLVYLFLAYYVCLFGVQETDLSRLYCLVISLGIAYVIIVKKENNVVQKSVDTVGRYD